MKPKTLCTVSYIFIKTIFLLFSDEAAEFEKNPDKEALVQLRQWDDEAKVEDIPATDNTFYIELARSVLSA
jgi:hypothetical protein